MKERSRLKFNATLATVAGVLYLISSVIIYFKYGRNMFAQTLEKHPDAYWFVFAFKTMFLGICPALCFILINLGVHVLNHLKKESAGL